MTLNFKRNSWHWKLAKQGGLGRFTDYAAEGDGSYARDDKGNLIETYDGDFCQYTRCVMAGAVAITVMTTLLALLAVLVSIFPLGFAYWLYQMFAAGKYLVPNPPAVIFMILMAAAAIYFFICPMIMKASYAAIDRDMAIRDAIRNGTYVPPKPSFLKEAYLKFKEKTCKRVVIQ